MPNAIIGGEWKSRNLSGRQKKFRSD
jgi:hypothetical protein